MWGRKFCLLFTSSYSVNSLLGAEEISRWEEQSRIPPSQQASNKNEHLSPRPDQISPMQIAQSWKKWACWSPLKETLQPKQLPSTDILSQKAGSTFLDFWTFLSEICLQNLFMLFQKILCFIDPRIDIFEQWDFSHVFWSVLCTIHLPLSPLRDEHLTEWPIQLGTEQLRKNNSFHLAVMKDDPLFAFNFYTTRASPPYLCLCTFWDWRAFHFSSLSLTRFMTMVSCTEFRILLEHQFLDDLGV